MLETCKYYYIRYIDNPLENEHGNMQKFWVDG